LSLLADDLNVHPASMVKETAVISIGYFRVL
jgi:hypothetical protein